jgi:hypothetical protein
LGERLVCNQEVTGSIPVSSTTLKPEPETKQEDKVLFDAGCQFTFGLEHWADQLSDFPVPSRTEPIAKAKIAHSCLGGAGKDDI